MPVLSDPARAVLWVTLSTALFSVVYASAKLAGGAAAPAQIILLRYAGGFATVLCLAARGGGPVLLRSRRPGAHLARAVCGCFGGGAIILASAQMPILDATAIGLLNVVLAVLLGAVLLGERITAGHGAAISAASCGALLIMLARGAFASFDAAYLWPAAVAGAGALLLALEAVLIRRLSQGEPLLTVLLYVNFFGICLMAVPAWLTWQPLQAQTVMALLPLGPLAIAAQYCTLRGYRMADVSVVGPVDYTWLIFAALIGLVVFGEHPGPGVLAGAALIALGGIGLIRASRPGAAERKSGG
ncbi:DMT family transporter [Roseobacteraceae bacterium NS-SX3]